MRNNGIVTNVDVRVEVEAAFDGMSEEDITAMMMGTSSQAKELPNEPLLRRVYPTDDEWNQVIDPNTVLGQLVRQMSEDDLAAILDALPDEQMQLHPAMREFRIALKMAQNLVDRHEEAARDAGTQPLGLMAAGQGQSLDVVTALVNKLNIVRLSSEAGEIEPRAYEDAARDLSEFETRLKELRIAPTSVFEAHTGHTGEQVVPDGAPLVTMRATVG